MGSGDWFSSLGLVSSHKGAHLGLFVKLCTGVI